MWFSREDLTKHQHKQLFLYLEVVGGGSLGAAENKDPEMSLLQELHQLPVKSPLPDLHHVFISPFSQFIYSHEVET